MDDERGLGKDLGIFFLDFILQLLVHQAQACSFLRFHSTQVLGLQTSFHQVEGAEQSGDNE